MYALLKNTAVKLDPEGSIWGVNDDQEIGQLNAEYYHGTKSEYDPELGQCDPIICQVYRKLSTSRVTFDPELGPIPVDSFPRTY